MDHTAGLRAKKGAIEEIQKGQKQMAQRKYDAAGGHFRRALKQAPNDYVALCMMSINNLAQKKYAVARQYAEMAQKSYPKEAQAYHMKNLTLMNRGCPEIQTSFFLKAIARKAWNRSSRRPMNTSAI
jgi:tetratricopeptide (TPR) repeat protein